MGIGDKIHFLRKRQNLTLEELGAKVGVSKSTIHKWETGQIENMKRDKIEALAIALDTSIPDLMGWKEVSSEKGVEIPVKGRVAAGMPIEAIENDLGTVKISEDLARTGDFFALQIHGDSMSPAILDGDIVIVREQPDAESGEIVIATVNGDDATCKRLRKYKDGIELVPNNPSYQTLEYSNKEIMEKPINIIGKVVELRRSF